ncbi:MAG: CYTH domain-containing protein [Burkholderia sp.]
MAIETEIKLALPAGVQGAARSASDAYAGAAGREIHLANVYYDTPDLALARAKSAVRVRLAPQGWLQIFKTVGSSIEQGLHTRHELELPVAVDALEIDALLTACADVPALVALFCTDFAHTLWRIVYDGSTFKAGLDLGKIIAERDGETRRAPIREIELELIDGDETVLQTLANELKAALPGLAPDAKSKAQHGYRLRAA